MGILDQALTQQFGDPRGPFADLNPQMTDISGNLINANLAELGYTQNGQQNPWFADWGQLGTAGKLGVIGQGLGAFSNLASLYGGFKQLGLQKDMFNFQKDAWQKNYNNQVKDYENTLKDRWAARRASAGARGGGFESMGSWVGSRSLTGEAPGYAAQSPQGFFAGNSVQQNTPIRRKGESGSGG